MTCIHSQWAPCCIEGDDESGCDGHRPMRLSPDEVSMLRMGRAFANLERMLGRFAEAFNKGYTGPRRPTLP